MKHHHLFWKILSINIPKYCWGRSRLAAQVVEHEQAEQFWSTENSSPQVKLKHWSIVIDL